MLTPYTVKHERKELFPYRSPRVTGGAMHSYGIFCRMRNIRMRNGFNTIMRKMAIKAVDNIFDNVKLLSNDEYRKYESKGKPTIAMINYNVTSQGAKS